MGPALAALNLGVGLFSILVNYLADAQRQEVREKNGKVLLGFGPNWGDKPALMEARYTTTKGEHKTSLMLINGYWGVSRHFHYIPELLAAFSWCCPGFLATLADGSLSATHATPFLYFYFLFILLMDRALRDEVRLSGKYGKDYDKYCTRVPWKVLPYVY